VVEGAAVTSVTDLRRNDDGRLEAALLPPQADALLNRAAAPRHWLGALPSPDAAPVCTTAALTA